MAKIKTALEMRQFWNNFSNIYEKTLLKTAIQVNTLLIPLLKVHHSHTVAECGCGTGTGIEILQHYYPNLSKILANDISEAMLQKAKAKNLSNSDFFLSNNETLPYNSESCDRYVSNLSLFFVEEPKNMLKEAFRVLKPNGIAVFSVLGQPGEHNYLSLTRRAIDNTQLVLPKERSLFHLSNQKMLNQLLRETGFANVRSFYTAVPMIVDNVEEYLEFVTMRSDFVEAKKKDQDKFEKFVTATRQEYHSTFDSGNFITFDALIVVGEKV